MPVWSAAEARRLLQDQPQRLRHSEAVAGQAKSVARVIDPAQGRLLVSAAYLHDIGYAASLDVTHFHPLDGARYLASVGLLPVARLVANHSGATVEAGLRGLADQLAEFDQEPSAALDALTFCDLTLDSAGEPISVDERLKEVRRFYGPRHVVVKALDVAEEELRGAVARTEQRLGSSVH
ncbi:MAG: HD domain-containing protein [Actinomycetota bacterium]